MTNDAHILGLKKTVADILASIDPVITMHDFRVAVRPSRTNLIFDIVVPYKYRITDEALTGQIQNDVRERMGEDYFVSIQVDKEH